MAFKLDENPFTHTIAYTLRGLLESSFFLEGNLKNKIINVVTKASKNIISKYHLSVKDMIKTFLPGTFDKNWESSDNYSCLTGNAQLSIIWLKLFKISKDPCYKDAAFNTIEKLKTTHHLKTQNNGIKGALPGSYPIWGKYQPFAYPNWATKFFADTLILKSQTLI